MEKTKVKIRELESGMKLAKGLINPFGVVIFPAETPITPCVKDLLVEMNVASIEVLVDQVFNE